VPFERAEQLHARRQRRGSGLTAWPNVPLGWFVFRHSKTLTSRTQTIPHAAGARNAPDLLGGCLRLPLPGAATRPSRMPRACPVEVHARCSERSAIPATNVTIHRASRWHSLVRSRSAARSSRQYRGDDLEATIDLGPRWVDVSIGFRQLTALALGEVALFDTLRPRVAFRRTQPGQIRQVVWKTHQLHVLVAAVFRRKFHVPQPDSQTHSWPMHLVVVSFSCQELLVQLASAVDR